MNNLYKIVVPLVVAVFALIGMFAFPRSVFASELDYTYDGREIPYLPDAVYGNHYLIYHTDLGTDDSADDYYCLYILTDYDPDSEVVYIEHDIVYMGGVDQISVNSGYIRYKYVYSINDGWTYHNSGGGSFVLVDNWTMISSTVDIFDKSNNELFFAKNADVIVESDIDVFLGDFGNLVNGFIGCVSKSTVGIVSFFMIVAGVVVGNFYLILWR